MKTIFFDIDGTLVKTAAGRDAMAAAITDVFGMESDPEGIEFAGRTDRGIIRDFFKRHEIQETEEMVASYCQSFLRMLAEFLPIYTGRVLDRVPETVAALAGRPDVRLGLLTGNLLEAARLKLAHFGLDHYFFNGHDTLGEFGDKQPHRDDLARDAMRQLEASAGKAVSRDDVWIIGDTPSDIQCARAINVRVAAVATGSYTAEELAKSQPDILLDDLHDYQAWFDLMEIQ